MLAPGLLTVNMVPPRLNKRVSFLLWKAHREFNSLESEEAPALLEEGIFFHLYHKLFLKVMQLIQGDA